MNPRPRRTLGIVLMAAAGLLVIAALLLLFGPGPDGPSYQTISPAEAKELLAGPDPVILVDVRTQEEYDQGHIGGAVLIPNTELSRRAPAELSDQGALIILYCRSGNRSAAAARELADLGYTRVFDLGGIIDWPYEVISQAGLSSS